MKHTTLNEFLYELFALIFSFIIVHSVYVTVVLPNAAVLLEEQRLEQATGGSNAIKKSIYIIIKDYEQESCIVLTLWVFAIMGLKFRTVLQERRLLSRSLLEVSPGTSILPEDARQYSRPIQTLPVAERDCLLPRTLLAALQRFGSTRNIPDVSTAIREICESESERFDTELSMIRFVIWIIPSLGFIGTVRGIGDALSQAHLAVQGDIFGVTVSLGVAFNSTLVALLLGIIIMFLMHQLQLLQERLVLDTRQYCDVNLVGHLQVR